MHTAHERLTILAEASGALFSSLSLEDILPAVGDLAQRLLPADGYALWRLDPDTLFWHAVWHQGLPDDFVASVAGWRDDGSLLPEPLLVSDTAAEGLLGIRLAAYVRIGIRSLAILPLRMRDRTHGTVVAYYRSVKDFSDTDRLVAAALSNLGSSALRTAVLYEAEARSRAEARVAEQRAVFLADAGTLLAGSLKYEETLEAVAHLAVPAIADWCAVDVVTGEGELKRLAMAHVDPARLALAERIEAEYPRNPDSPYGVHAVVRSRTSVILPEISRELVVATARDARHADLVLQLGLESYMCVPLVAHGRALGAMVFATAGSGRRFMPADLRFAEDVAARAALAVANARAYEDVSRANRLKDEFLATLSHELRTPLNAVLGYTRMLRTGAVPPEKNAWALETLERNAAALTQLVEDVLDVSRIQAGKIRLDVQAIDLSTVLDAALDTVAPAASGRGVRVQKHVEADLPLVQGDADRLQQVIWNLLSNAVKFTPAGGEVRVVVRPTGEHVDIVVRDTGMGIQPEFLPHMFERFRQGDAGSSREHGGLGLGLAISRHLVEMHGGMIEASSEGPGTGAEFLVRLPARAAAHAVLNPGIPHP